MHPYIHAQKNPDKAAYIMAGSGETVTYGQLDDRSNQGAQLFRSIGLNAGDVVAIMLENHPRYFEITWAAQRSGLYYACIVQTVGQRSRIYPQGLRREGLHHLSQRRFTGR